jgi:hypothetical protein
MRIKCLACEALARPTYLAAAYSPHIVDIEMVKRGLHNRPIKLRDHLQALVDSAAGAGYDAVTLVYGLCGQAIAGLVAKDVRLVIPKAHDCITLFLGSRRRYTYQFDNYPGTYWYSHDYIERDDGSGSSLSMGSGTDTDLEAVYEEYVEKYGKDNADYLMEAMGAWQSHYRRAVFIDMGVGDASQVEQRARQEADRRGWLFERMAGDLVLVRRLLNGDWDGDFLVLEPGQVARMSYDEDVLAGMDLLTEMK